METTALEGASRLVDYGLLGIFLLIALGAIVYIVKQYKETVVILIADKDKQIANATESIEKRDVQLDGAISLLTANSTRMMDLYEHQQRSIDAVPDRTAEKVQILLRK